MGKTVGVGQEMTFREELISLIRKHYDLPENERGYINPHLLYSIFNALGEIGEEEDKIEFICDLATDMFER